MNGLLIAFFLIAAAASLIALTGARSRLIADSYISDREAHATHLLMNGTMAVMMSSLYGRFATGLIIACAIGAAVLAIRAAAFLASPSGSGGRIFGTLYHLLTVAAMIYAIRLMPAVAHDIRMPVGQSFGGWPAIALGALLLVDGLATFVLVAFMPRTLLRMELETGLAPHRHDPIPIRIRSIRIAAFPHIVMDIGMALMLLPLVRM